MDKVRFGLVGAGAIAASHITAITGTEGAELAAICEKNEQRIEQLKKEFSVPFFTDIEQMLSEGLVDAVDITTPSGMHLDPALKAIDAGVHVLVEKPMEITTERIDRMIKAAENSNVKLGCVFQARFKEFTTRTKNLLDRGILGDIYSGSAYCKLYRTQEYYDSGGWRGTWEIDGGGALMNQGIHTVDFLLWNMGNAEEVIAVTESRGRRNVEVETLALALLKFKNGAKGVLEGTTLAYPGLPEHVEIFGSRGTITFGVDEIYRFELIDPTPEEEKARDEILAAQKQAKAQSVKVKKEDVGTVVTSADQGHTPVIGDFAEAIRTDRDPFIPGREARKSVELITSIYKSAGNNSQPVKLGGE